MSKINYPNLFIIGAPKCGTTFVYNKFKNHPAFFCPIIKELNYFSFEHLNETSYYKDYKISSSKTYLNFYKNRKNQKYLVDASVSYFNDFDSHKKLFEFNKDAKIIIMYRDPIKRAFSHYKMDLRMGYADLPFKDYLDKNRYPKHFSQYVENSMYGSSLKNLYMYFDKKNIITINLDNIEIDFKRMLNILKVDVSHGEFTFEKVNENKLPTNGVAKFLQHNRNLATKLKLFIPKKFIKLFKKMSYKKANDIAISDEESQIMQKLIENDQLRFNKLKI